MYVNKSRAESYCALTYKNVTNAKKAHKLAADRAAAYDAAYIKAFDEALASAAKDFVATDEHSSVHLDAYNFAACNSVTEYWIAAEAASVLVAAKDNLAHAMIAYWNAIPEPN